MLLKRGTGSVEREKEKYDQSRELEKELRIGFKLGFISIVFSPSPSLLPNPRSSTICHRLEERNVHDSLKKELPFSLNKK